MTRRSRRTHCRRLPSTAEFQCLNAVTTRHVTADARQAPRRISEWDDRCDQYSCDQYRRQESNLHVQRTLDPKSSASANSATPAQGNRNDNYQVALPDLPLGEVSSMRSAANHRQRWLLVKSTKWRLHRKASTTTPFETSMVDVAASARRRSLSMMADERVYFGGGPSHRTDSSCDQRGRGGRVSHCFAVRVCILRTRTIVTIAQRRMANSCGIRGLSYRW